jgi:RND family efflux transporter MFP subunit
VTVAPLGEVAIHPLREAPASVVPRNESRLSAEITAPVRDIGADVGQTVARGAVLARLDDTDYRLAVDRARAQHDAAASRLKLAERQLERARELQKNNFLSPEALNQRETEVASLKADMRVIDTEITAARRQLDKTMIRAPYDAVVRTRDAQVGELAVPGALLFVLTEIGASEVSARIAAEQAEWLPQMREPVFEAGGRSVPVRLLRVSPITDPESRTRETRLAFATANDGRNGSAANGSAANGSAANGSAANGAASGAAEHPPGTGGRLLWRDPRAHLPAELIVRRNSVLGAFIDAGGRAQFVAAVQAQEGRPAIVPLPADARVVVRGQAALQDGVPLRISGP